MTKGLRIYYYALFGAIGGVVAWQLSNWLGLSISSNFYLSTARLGAVLGFCFGFPIGSVEGFIARSPIKLLTGGVDTVDTPPQLRKRPFLLRGVHRRVRRR